jgi:Ca-activated chloride channel family protein
MFSYTPNRSAVRSRNGLAHCAGLSAVMLALAIMCVWVGGANAQQQQQTPPPVVPLPHNPVPPPPPQNTNPNKPKISVDVELVALHAAVIDRRGVFVNDLPPDAFHVYEDKVEQTLKVAKQEDVPVSMGLVVDSSGSMFEKRAKVNAAALTFVQTSNPQDEAFVVNFNDEYYLDTVDDFTSDIGEMKDALARFDPRGSTALYDAIIGSVDHLKKAHRDKRVLLVMTDGEDNASKNSLADTIRIIQHSDAIIYAVGLFGKDEKGPQMRKARRALQDLADATGGLAFFPEAVEDTEAICKEIAHDIRNQYTLAYYPTHYQQDGTFRSVQVVVNPPRDKGKLTVRTRTGYYAKTASSSNTK